MINIFPLTFKWWAIQMGTAKLATMVQAETMARTALKTVLDPSDET